MDQRRVRGQHVASNHTGAYTSPYEDSTTDAVAVVVVPSFAGVLEKSGRMGIRDKA